MQFVSFCMHQSTVVSQEKWIYFESHFIFDGDSLVVLLCFV